jgi:hypothetical protein
MKYLFWGPQKIFSLAKPTSKYIFKRYITLKIVNPLKLSKYFFFHFTRLCGFTIGFYGASIMKIFMKYLFWGPQHIFSLEKPTSKIFFQALHHLEDSDPLKLSKDFFHFTRLCGFTIGF